MIYIFYLPSSPASPPQALPNEMEQSASMRSNLTTFPPPPCGCGIHFIDSLGTHEKVGTAMVDRVIT